MSVPSLSALEPGARVWVRDPDCVWAAALVEGPGDAANTVRVALVPNASFASGSVAPTTRTVGQGDVFLANPPPVSSPLLRLHFRSRYLQNLI